MKKYLRVFCAQAHHLSQFINKQNVACDNLGKYRYGKDQNHMVSALFLFEQLIKSKMRAHEQ